MGSNKLSRIKFFIGVDISKATFNYCLRYGGGNVFNGKVGNNVESITEFISGLKQVPNFKLRYTVFGMEVTGVYGLILIKTLAKMKAKVVVEPALRIKNSLGIIRGKNDKLDAARIARYLIKNLQELKLWVPRRKIIDELSSLSTLRERIVKVRTIMVTPLEEDDGFIDPSISKSNIDLCQPSINHINDLVPQIDDRIKILWKNDVHCNRLMQIMLSVMGIGDVTALQILIHTNEFKSITTARTFASYCGVAPFEHNSGTSLNKNARVSPFANKRIKSLLHNGVRACIPNDPEIKAYYIRRVEVDKKNKMSVMNAIKFKIICRVFACVRADRLYDRNYVSVKPNEI
ncbi:transposase [Pedobacter sp. Leaf250]|uniref:transposase n=1 Tax=Pedobacter sp. Leaf250 TaxID=2876559 RepID=UPI001E3EABDC|nr:transposase [Pedobacter sp. Leaf250]